MISLCSHMFELMRNKVVHHKSRCFTMKDGSGIYWIKGESAIQNYQELRYNSIYEESDYLEKDAFNESSEDDFSVCAILEFHSDNEYPACLVHVMPVKRTIKKSTPARKEIFNGIHLPPVNKGLYKGKSNENYRQYPKALEDLAKWPICLQDRPGPLKDKNVENTPKIVPMLPNKETVWFPLMLEKSDLIVKEVMTSL